jgi:signal transduction histidine kinase
MTAAEPAATAADAALGAAAHDAAETADDAPATPAARAAASAAHASAPRIRPPLLRPREVFLAGVCAALARHLGFPVGPVRAVAVALVAVGTVFGLVAARIGWPVSLAAVGATVLLYVWLWVLTPREPGAPEAPRTRRVPIALLLLIAAGIAALATLVLWRSTAPVAPGSIETGVLAVGSYLWAALVDPRDPRFAGWAPRMRMIAAALLGFAGLLMLPQAVIEGRPIVAVAAVVFLLLCAAGLSAPPLLARIGARSAERAAAARDEQRSEIAAHLHDSVLQTLAIIQNRAGAGTEVARIARAQERELRDWLFAGTDPFAGDLATELKTIARELELEHAVRIEVVTVGDVGAIESAALAGAAREALVNAARHAGGDVTVYAEATPDAVEVFVRDRGAGFDPDAVPDGRLGIRESVVGRMSRAGGTGAVTSDADGTEVQLRLPRRAAGVASGTAASGTAANPGGAA